MGVAYFIVAEREVEGLDTFVDGKSLAHCPYVEGLAAQAGVRPLMDFFSMSPEDAESFLGDEAEDEGSPPVDLPPEQWFDPEDGLVTVRGLLSRLEAGPVDLPDDRPHEGLLLEEDDLEDLEIDGPRPEPSDVIEDLREFEALLCRLAEDGVRWHLAVDF